MSVDDTQYEEAVDDLESVPLVPDQGEDESDLDDPPSTFSASVGSKDWTVETLVSQMRKGRIDLDPTFQRRNAWLGNRKSKLIESIMLGFPIPQIVLAERPDLAGHYFVLDGKQRLLALRQFFVESANSADAGFEPLRLTGLEVLSELNRRDAAGLERVRPDLLAAIENHSIRTVVLGQWNSERLLLSLFLRLNTGSVPLSPQELRQALIHGEFMAWLDAKSGELPSLRTLLGNSHADRRMVDAELALRHIAFTTSPLQYAGNLKKFLDETSRVYNSRWSILQAQAEEALGALDSALNAGAEMFGRDVFCRKWSSTKFERALNRAVFDVQVYSLSIPRVRNAMVGNESAILQAFREACDTDFVFSQSISATTKTLDAFITRHRVWREIVRETCGVEYEIPDPLRRS